MRIKLVGQREPHERLRGPERSRARRMLARLSLFAVLTGMGLPQLGASQTTDTALGPATTEQGAGHFSINRPNLTEYTQESTTAIISWEHDLYQAPGHSLEFRQGAGFSILNQSPGERPSEFYGNVICDATCIFANEAGIYFGDGSYIDVGQMFAVGGRIAEGDFLSGLHHFTDLRGPVINHGSLHGERIALLGHHVANYGHVETPDGSFMMLAADEVWLRDHDSPILVRTGLPEPTAPETTASVVNEGSIQARGGEVRLAAGDLLSFAIFQSDQGDIAASEIVIEAGETGRVNVRGELDARGLGPDERGGQIDVLGDYVAIEDGALLDASGAAGGGRIRVGGGRGGQGVRPARGTFVDRSAEIRADASVAGDGGEIIIWAEETAQVYGTLSARGGPAGGGGGFIETSGKEWLDISRAPELAARSGRPEDRGGEWLIDPNNIAIVNRPSDSEPCDPADPSCVPCDAANGTCLDPGLETEPPYFGGAGGPIIRPTVDDSNIDAQLIIDTLVEGVNVIILTETVAETQGDQDGNIRVIAELRIDDASVNPGTTANLLLYASNDLTIDQFIGVDRADSSTPSNMTLNLDLQANSPSQAQNVAPADQIPNNYLGTLQVNADLKTGGGATTLYGSNVILAENASIETEGGDLRFYLDDGFNVPFYVGNIELRGHIDTSNPLASQEPEAILGGSLTAISQAVRRPFNSLDNLPSAVVGGNIIVTGTIQTGGGAVNLESIGGNIEIDSEVDTGGNDIELFSYAQLFAPLTSADTGSITTGGRITIGNEADIKTLGGDFAAGYAPTLAARATEIVVRGRIDTTAPPSDDDEPQVGGSVSLAAELPDGTSGEPGRIVIKRFEDDERPVRIATGGGGILAASDGSFFMDNATLDASGPEGLETGTPDSQIQLRFNGDIQIQESHSGETLLIASELIELAYSDFFGNGNILIAGNPEFHSDKIALQAGYAGNAGEGLGQVDLGDSSFRGFTNPDLAPTEFALAQQASLATDGITDRINGGSLEGMTNLLLATTAGELHVGNPASLSSLDLNLTLQALEDVSIDAPFSQDPAEQLESLTIDVQETFSVSAETAGYLSGSARNLSISTGFVDEQTEANLELNGDLSSFETLVLHAGIGGNGNLIIEASDTSEAITLSSEAITLRAGNGDLTGESTIALSPNILFQDNQGGKIDSFTLWQDDLIDDGVIPDASAFAFGSVDDIAYTLRGDVGRDGVSLSIGPDSVDALRDSRLHLWGAGEIEIEETLTVRSMDLGGINAFTFTQDLNEKIEYTDDAQSRLTLRAGFGGEGVLAFEENLTIQADEIRLVAGDGTADDPDEVKSYIVLGLDSESSPTFLPRSSQESGVLTFVFRQDADITDSSLPTMESIFGDLVPHRVAIRSDSGQILFEDFADTPVVQATDQIVLSASDVSLLRQDGQNLELEQVLQLTAGPAHSEAIVAPLQIRSDSVTLSATETLDGAENKVEVLPGHTVRLTAFDSQPDEIAPGSPPPAFDFEDLPEDAPGLIALEQDGDIRHSDASNTNNLIDPQNQLGRSGAAALNEYLLASHQGSIDLTPQSVVGSNLALLLIPDDDIPPDNRTINFSTGSEFLLESLYASTPFSWTVASSDTSEPIELTASGILQLEAGTLGNGDLDVTGNITLTASSIFLGAGDDPASRADHGDASADHSVVNARSDTTRFVLMPNDLGITSFEIRQNGDLTSQSATSGQSQLPNSDQFEIRDPDGLGISTEGMTEMYLTASDGNLVIDDLFVDREGETVSTLPTQSLNLAAGYLQSTTPRTIRLTQNNTVNLEPGIFETFSTRSANVEFISQGSLIRLDDSLPDSGRILLFGGLNIFAPLSLTPPESILFQQEVVEFQERDDCAFGCLPNPLLQIGQSTVAGVEYTIANNQAEGSILVDNAMANKLDYARLTLQASDVIFNIDSPRSFDLLLESLAVTSSEAVPHELVSFETSAEQPLTIYTVEDQIYDAAIQVENRVELLAANITIGSSVLAAAGGQQDELVLFAESQTLIQGHVGSPDDERNLELLRIQFDPAQASSASAEFGFGDGLDTEIWADAIEFFYSTDLNASTSDPVVIPTVATLFKRDGNLSFYTRTFNMAMGQKLSVQGDLLIHAYEKATLGDLSAIQMTVISDLIEIQRRPGGQYLTPSLNLFSDSGVDYVANQIVFQNIDLGVPTLQLSGTGMNPTFGLFDPSEIPDWMRAFSTFETQASSQALANNNFDLTGYTTLADLHPDGASRDDPSTLYFNQAIPPLPRPWEPSSWSPFNRASVEELDIDVEPMTPREYRSQLLGATIIEDVGRDFTRWNGRPLEVSESRIDGSQAARAVALMHELFGPRGTRAERVREILQQALDQYRRNTGARRVVGFELRRYVKNRPSSLYQAYQALEDLSRLFDMHRSLGLTPGEYRPIQERWLEVITPSGITPSELAEAIHPSRYVRGSDVLDIFGD